MSSLVSPAQGRGFLTARRRANGQSGQGASSPTAELAVRLDVYTDCVSVRQPLGVEEDSPGEPLFSHEEASLPTSVRLRLRRVAADVTQVVARTLS